MNDLELSLQLLHLFIEPLRLGVAHQVSRGVERVRTFEGGGILEEKVEDWADDPEVTVEQARLSLGREVVVVGEDAEELGDMEDDFLGLGLVLVDVDVGLRNI